MIENKPGIYNDPSIYDQGGGGGGGEPIPDPSLYQKAQGLKRTSSNLGLPVASGNFLVNNSDKIFLSMYLTWSSNLQVEIYETVSFNRWLRLQPNSSTSLRVNNDGKDINTPDYFTIESHKNNEFIFNDYSFTAGSYSSGDSKLDKFWQDSYNCSSGSICFEFSVSDKDGNPKFKFLPYKRLADGKIGLLEIYSNTFIEAPNDWELIGLYPQ